MTIIEKEITKNVQKLKIKPLPFRNFNFQQRKKSIVLCNGWSRKSSFLKLIAIKS